MESAYEKKQQQNKTIQNRTLEQTKIIQKTERGRLLGGEGTSPPFSPHPPPRPCPHFSNTTYKM